MASDWAWYGWLERGTGEWDADPMDRNEEEDEGTYDEA